MKVLGSVKEAYKPVLLGGLKSSGASQDNMQWTSALVWINAGWVTRMDVIRDGWMNRSIVMQQGSSDQGRSSRYVEDTKHKHQWQH